MKKEETKRFICWCIAAAVYEQVPVATWMSVMSQSSTNSAILIWCIAAAVYEKKHSAHLAG